MSILDVFSLEGKVALVTGGAGLYGRQIVAALGEAGAKTYIASRNLEVIEAVAEEHRNLGQVVAGLRLDLADEASILALRDKIVEESGRLDVLINNAVARPMKNGFWDDLEFFDESMKVNATGLFAATRAFGDVMAQQGSGSIINICSIYGMVGPDPTNYVGASKHVWHPDYFFHKGGMINFMRFAGCYYGRFGIRCNCVSPGGLPDANDPDFFIEQYSSRTFLGRMANSTDLKGVIVFLASDASAYITGANIPVDGGYTAK